MISPGIGGAARGGGCYNAGTFTITNSTFFSATAWGGSGGDAAAAGDPGTGGDGEGGGISNHGDLQLVNVTIYKNAAVGGSYGTPAIVGQSGQRGGAVGGGIFQAATGAVHVINTRRRE